MRAKISCAGRGAIAIALLVAAASAESQAPLSLYEALRIAEERAPVLAASHAAARGMRERGRLAAELPDPVLRAGIDNLPVTGPDAFSIGADFMTMRRIGVAQEFVSRDKRMARAGAGPGAPPPPRRGAGRT